MPTMGAIWRLGRPSAASSTIRARLAARWGSSVGTDPALQLRTFGLGDHQRRDGRHGSGSSAASLRSHHMSETNAELHPSGPSLRWFDIEQPCLAQA